jgi:hypothetical protein
MSIVLAIEPDRRQAAHLTALARQLVDAELVLADTTERALDAIGNRVPDLVLVPALLSPQDDAALAAALRVIAAAAHVRTLTIPVLASGITRAPAGGMLAKWRKHRPAPTEPDGCDPAVFGEQISAYLREAAAERAQLEEDALLNAERTEADSSTQSLELSVRSETPTPVPADAAFVPAAVIEQAWNDAEPIYPEPVPPLYPEPVPPLVAAPLEELTIQPGDDPLIDLSDELDGLSQDVSAGTSDDEAAAVYTIATEADTPVSVFDAVDQMPDTLEPPSFIEDLEAALDEMASAARVQAEPAPVTRRRGRPVGIEPVVGPPPAIEAAALPRPDITPWEPMYLTPGRIWPALEGVPAETPTARTEQPDWIELVASLRQDLERRRTDPASAAAPDPIAKRPSDGVGAKLHRLVKKPRPFLKKAKPVQDEWGFFDPERCGFSTLLAKLEEITEEIPEG